MSTTKLGWFGLVGRGMAMGVAEVVPGVSGGTIAFVTGIYDELVRTLAGFSHRSLATLATQGPVVFWREHNLGFLALLLVGMLLSIGLFSRLLSHWLATLPTLVWGFFFGLILVSVWQIGKAQPPRVLLLFAPIGAAAGLLLGQLDPLPTDQSLGVFFIGGVVAISAWMLPAVSGSFMLLVLGLYQAVIDAVTGWQWDILVSVALGCGVGMLAFAKLLAWLLRRNRGPVLALLTGFMLGSLPRLWPWRDGAEVLTPSMYQAMGHDPMILATILLACVGGIALWFLTRLE
jgi:putative membrane protein